MPLAKIKLETLGLTIGGKSIAQSAISAAWIDKSYGVPDRCDLTLKLLDSESKPSSGASLVALGSSKKEGSGKQTTLFDGQVQSSVWNQ